MNCRTCGVTLPDHAARCPNCGAPAQSGQDPKARPAVTAAGAPPRNRPQRQGRPVGMGKYFLWWTVALFSNAEIVCMVLSLVFVFDTGDKNRANFFRAVLLFKLILLLVGVIAVIVLAFHGFSFTDLLNRIGPRALWELLQEVF